MLQWLCLSSAMSPRSSRFFASPLTMLSSIPCMLPTAGASTSTLVASTNCLASSGVDSALIPSGLRSRIADDEPMLPISPSTTTAGLIDLRVSTARRVSSTFFSNGSAEPSKMISSKPAFAASTALASECVWSALRKIGKPCRSRAVFTSAADSATPMNSRSPSETPTITGSLSSDADSTIALNAVSSEILKCPTAT